MKPRLARALLVVTVFVLLGVVSATSVLVTDMLKPPPPPPPAGVAGGAPSAAPSSTAPGARPDRLPPAGERFVAGFRAYLSWALVTPGILWLGRAVPFTRRRWPLAVAFHLAAPVVFSLPFVGLRILVNAAFGLSLAGVGDIAWSRAMVLQTFRGLPVYWLLLAAGAVLQVWRDSHANALRAVELQRSLVDAQLDALKMKLQPHFLFNTLNAMVALAKAGQTDAVVRAVERLGTLLRLSMDMSARQVVALDEELALLDAYLAIQQVRFGERLHVVWRVTPEARGALVPNLILQPLVENALVHGLSRRVDASVLEIVAHRAGPDLRIAVRDDGPGLPDGWNFALHARAGLKNVADRVTNLFPSAGRFEMVNGATGGAVALLSFPFADAATTAVGDVGDVTGAGRSITGGELPGRRGRNSWSAGGAAGRRRALLWTACALAVCATLSLHSVVVGNMSMGLDPELSLATVHEQAAWSVLDYLGWATLTPLIFFLARRVPVRRDRWVLPIAFHLVSGLIITGAAAVLFSNLGAVYIRGYSWADMPNPFAPFWTRYAVFRAVGDSITYWMVLGAGFALLAFDEDQARRRENAELERSLVAAQVDSLKMKLQPHFLFNTLNSISFLALERDTAALVTMIERLGALLRSSMRSGGSQLVALGEELALLDQYLSIEEVRFADRLSVGRCIDPSARDALVPSLVLQPIVENSIKHGFSRRIDARRIDIAVRRDADALLFTVEDDGPGMPDGWSITTHCGRGLKNVIDRIDRLYPGAWSFSLANRPGGGALAALRIPWQSATGSPAIPGGFAHP